MIWTEYEINDRLALLQGTAENEGVPELAVEKDWWVTAVLKALSETEISDNLLFKGGTSLSKGWSIIKRFSEDIDLAINRSFFDLPDDNAQQKNKIRKKSFKYVRDILKPELETKLEALGLTGYSVEFTSGTNSSAAIAVIDVNYESILEETNPYILPKVKIEIGAMSLADPYEIKDLSTLIHKYHSEVDEEINVAFKTVVPGRTFLEKVFLLNEEFLKRDVRSERMSRHLYDLANLMDHDEVQTVFQDTELYETIVKHRATFNALPDIDYNNNHPTRLSCCPPEKYMKAWSEDYDKMKESFIYEEKPFSFEELLARVESIKNKLLALKIADNFLDK
jgi:predicted nucleotidyltransferase component of viral defense system